MYNIQHHETDHLKRSAKTMQFVLMSNTYFGVHCHCFTVQAQISFVFDTLEYTKHIRILSKWKSTIMKQHITKEMLETKCFIYIYNDNDSHRCFSTYDATSVDFSTDHLWIHPLSRHNICPAMTSIDFINLKVPVSHRAKSFALKDALLNISP